MKGSIFKRVLDSGRIDWCLQIDAGRDEAGNRKRISKSGFRLKGDAEKELRDLLGKKDRGKLVRPDPKTFGEFLEQWLTEYAAPNCSPKTAERYRELAAYVVALLGSAPLQGVTTLHLQRMYNRLKESGGKDGATLAAQTVHGIAAVVHTALRSAVEWGLLEFNPATSCRLPKIEHREARALDRGKLEQYLTAARGQWLYPLLVFASGTGCRRGECCAVAWPDVDLFEGSVVVSKSVEQTRDGLRIKSPKNGKFRRLPLPASVVQVLRFHREQQEENRRLFGSDYKTALDLVFAAPDGSYLKPDNVTVEACRLAHKAGLDGVGLHTLRHSHGSQLLACGVPLPTVSKRLGHSNVAITARVYSHSFAEDETAAAVKWDLQMRAAIEGAASKNVVAANGSTKAPQKVVTH